MSNASSTVLVTGGTGFLGSLIARRLLQKGDKVVCYDASVANTPMDVILTKEEKSAVKVLRGDITDFQSLLNTIREYKVNKIIHLAYILAPVSETNPTLASMVNIMGTNYIFEAARIMSLDKVVWASATSVWGQFSMGKIAMGRATETEPLKDDAPHRPTTVYGATKSANEFMASHFTETFKVDITGLRMSRVVGVGKLQGATREFADVLWKVAKLEPVVIPNGDFVKSDAHGDDIARAFVLASEARFPKTPVFNTHGFEHTTNRQLAEILRELEPRARITVEPSVPGAFLGYRLDPSNIRAELGYSPRYTMRSMVKEILDEFRKMDRIDQKRVD